MDMHRKEKNRTQEWLKGIPFSHFITVEPSAPHPYRRNDVIQRFRQIEFEVNKKYLPTSFPSWKDEDRFWMVGWREGHGSDTHYHLVLHSPLKMYRTYAPWDMSIGWDIQLRWIQMTKINPYNGKRLKNHPLHIVPADDASGSVVYASKWMDRGNEVENYFYITPPKSKPSRFVA